MLDHSLFQRVPMPEPKPVYTIDSVPILSGTVYCRQCGRSLADWVQAGRKTVILVPHMMIYRASLICRCGAQTEWYSQLVSAIHLGIDGQPSLDS
jgi:hypothetical protein